MHRASAPPLSWQHFAAGVSALNSVQQALLAFTSSRTAKSKALVAELLDTADIVFCTLMVVGRQSVRGQAAFDALVVDEAAQVQGPS